MRILFAAALVIAAAASASAQPAAQPAAAQPDPEHVSLKDRLKEPDQAGGLHFTEHFAVAFGGIKQGSGAAIGPAYSTLFSDGGFVQLKAVYSVKRFWVVQARYDTRRFWSKRAILSTRLRLYDAPKLALYHLGPASPDLRVDYSERRTDGTATLLAKPTPVTRIVAGFGVERFTTGADPLPPPDDLPRAAVVPQLPGLATHPVFAHTVGSAAYDTRLSPDYSRNGHVVEIALHDYHDVRDGQDSFRRLETTLQQLVPMFDERGVAEIGLRTWFTGGKNDGSVPFYLMPTLGGGDLLRAFPSYRFRDRNAYLIKAEYRWAVHDMVDLAGIYEGGKVAPEVGKLDFTDMAHSIAAGVRVHSKTSSLFRADLAHGREGFGFRVGFTAGM